MEYSLKHTLTQKLKSDKLLKVVMPSFLVHFIAALLALALMFIMTRTLGAGQYGLFTFSFSVIFIIVNLTTYGIDILTVREIPALLSTGKTGLWKGFTHWASRRILIISLSTPLLVLASIYIFVYKLHLIKETAYVMPIIYAITSIPFYGLMSYYSSALRGQNKPVLSLLPDNIFKPVAFLIGFIVVYCSMGGMTLRNAIFLNSLSFVIGLALTLFMYKRTTPATSIETQYDVRKWKTAWRSLFLLTIVVSINSRLDIMMLGILKESYFVGIYATADRVAGALIIFLTIMNLITAATISKLHTLNEKEKLQALITGITRGVMLLSIPVFVIIVLFRNYILSFFGPHFSEGQEALIIIAAGQLVSIAFGPIGNMAIMTNNEKSFIKFTIGKIVLNIILNLVLTPTLGINGTAISTSLCIIFFNISMYISIKKKTGISTWIFG